MDTNLLPIRNGLYSCELISDTAFTTPVDLKFAIVFIQKTDNKRLKEIE